MTAQVNTSKLTAKDIESWLVNYLTKLLEIKADEIENSVPINNYGLDSSAIVVLTGELENWLGKEIDPTIIYDYPTVKSLSKYLAEKF